MMARIEGDDAERPEMETTSRPEQAMEDSEEFFEQQDTPERWAREYHELLLELAPAYEVPFMPPWDELTDTLRDLLKVTMAEILTRWRDARPSGN